MTKATLVSLASPAHLADWEKKAKLDYLDDLDWLDCQAVLDNPARKEPWATQERKEMLASQVCLEPLAPKDSMDCPAFLEVLASKANLVMPFLEHPACQATPARKAKQVCQVSQARRDELECQAFVAKREKVVFLASLDYLEDPDRKVIAVLMDRQDVKANVAIQDCLEILAYLVFPAKKAMLVETVFLVYRVPRESRALALLDFAARGENLACLVSRDHLEILARMVYLASKEKVDSPDCLANLASQARKEPPARLALEETRVWLVGEEPQALMEHLAPRERLDTLVNLARLAKKDIQDRKAIMVCKDHLVYLVSASPERKVKAACPVCQAKKACLACLETKVNEVSPARLAAPALQAWMDRPASLALKVTLATPEKTDTLALPVCPDPKETPAILDNPVSLVNQVHLVFLANLVCLARLDLLFELATFWYATAKVRKCRHVQPEPHHCGTDILCCTSKAMRNRITKIWVTPAHA